MLRWDLVVRVERDDIIWIVDGSVWITEFPRDLLLLFRVGVGDDENALVSVIASVIIERAKNVVWIANNAVAVEPLLKDILLYSCS